MFYQTGSEKSKRGAGEETTIFPFQLLHQPGKKDEKMKPGAQPALTEESSIQIDSPGRVLTDLLLASPAASPGDLQVVTDRSSHQKARFRKVNKFKDLRYRSFRGGDQHKSRATPTRASEPELEPRSSSVLPPSSGRLIPCSRASSRFFFCGSCCRVGLSPADSSMLKPGQLVFLLAASQVGLHLSALAVGAGQVDISQCPITLFGREYSEMEVSYDASQLAFCSVGSSPDCLYLENPQLQQASVKVVAKATNPGSQVHTALPYIQSASPCWVEVEVQDQDNSTHLQVSLYNFGSQAVLQLNATNFESPVNVSVTFGINSFFSHSFQSSDWQNGLILDVSGCRSGDRVLSSGSVTFQPESCSNLVCNQSAVLGVVSVCAAVEMCMSNGGCAPRPSVCSVIGSTVMDFSSRVHSITNRCVYILMTAGGDSAFNLLAAFREQRRRDVMFLDHLILWLSGPNVTIYLEQGGRVQVEEEVLQLNATSRLVHGVELSKDQTGVTASIPGANVTVYFDGSAAHVAGKPPSVEGLCGNPDDSSLNISLIAARSTSYSEAGCDTEYTDVVDPTIDCNSTRQHCDLMRQPPFTACHEHADPEPFITACETTLCNYPAVDGLRCRFLEAYAKSCSLQDNVQLGDWRPALSCPAAAPVPCLDVFCSRHEFCGIENAQTRCLCRANFASKYKATNALGEPTVCMHSSATLSLAGCLLEEKGIDYTQLQLADMNCPGLVDQQTHMVTFSFGLNNSCGTEVITNSSQVIYRNSIMARNSSAEGVISRHSQVDIDFSCYYDKPAIKTVAFKVKDSTVIEHIVAGIWNYTLIMNAYTDPGRTQLIDPTSEIGLNQRIWVELMAEGLDEETVALVIESCWSTNQPSPDGGVRYDLIVQGCPNTKDQTVQMDVNGAGTSNHFSFNMFEFPGNEDGIYLHCRLELCLRQGNSCIKVCGQRRRRRSGRRD
ncbi:uncharacterized protein LOC121635530 [Melanotaenia boesemani]|uniref:uncharacterized protein LOC121635530 n=1 Tax=Melanotaenia boesemani TaxID=1250792 RepID=UPI001C03FCF1|nr:uncharacterized protein LOC121635530 [Melanotaenia boesemani]